MPDSLTDLDASRLLSPGTRATPAQQVEFRSPLAFPDALLSDLGGALHVRDERGTSCVPRLDLLKSASRVAAGLRASGVDAGGAVGCLLTNDACMVAAMLGVWQVGARVVSLPLPARGAAAHSYALGLAEMCRRAEVTLLLGAPQVLQALPDLGVQSVSPTALPVGPPVAPHLPRPDDTVLVQFSSGSTRRPTGCELSLRAVAAQLDLLSETLPFDRADRMVSWLPLAHDMGLVGGLLLPLSHGADVLLTAPSRGVGRPQSWMQDCVDFAGTVSPAPSIALELAARGAAARPLNGSLALRACVIGGERVSARALLAAERELGPYGLRPEALRPAYGMAEATLAVTMQPATRRWRTARFEVDGRQTQLVGAGVPLHGVELRVAGEHDFGEIVVRSPSLARGYLGDARLTRERFSEGGLRTGDIGTIKDGELFLLGRSDDQLKVAGRKVWAGEVEDELGREDALRPGSLTLVQVADPAGGGLALIGELADGADERVVAARLRSRARREFQLRLTACMFVGRGKVPKTSSGKVQRHRATALASELLADR